ncbi:MAG: hypothetical protein SchgKO_22330 [Schleiferiaceae bacterium]
MSKSKLHILFAVFLWVSSTSFVKSKWSPKQMKAANTAVNANYLNAVEKETVLYLNLARLYPQNFSDFEVKPYTGTPKYGDYVAKSPYKKSLLKLLKKQKPLKALQPDQKLSKSAQCFAAEQGKTGYVGHTRQGCPRAGNGECCSYGMSTGKDIAMQFLIDHNVPGEGHREMIYMSQFTKVGVGTYSHTQYEHCAVVELK